MFARFQILIVNLKSMNWILIR